MTDDITIRGEPMPLDELLEFADIAELTSPTVVDSAVDWWDENATPPFIGVLEQ